MDMTIDLTQIILAIITLIGGIVARYLVPWIKEKLTNQKAQALNGVIRIAVFAAEQLYKSQSGQEKKQYVLNLLQSNGYDINSALIDAAIEAQVKELQIEMSSFMIEE